MPTPEEQAALQAALDKYTAASQGVPPPPASWNPGQTSAFNRAVQNLPNHPLYPTPQPVPSVDAPMSEAQVFPTAAPVMPSAAPVNPALVNPNELEPVPSVQLQMKKPYVPSPEEIEATPVQEATGSGNYVTELGHGMAELDRATTDRVRAYDEEGEAKALGSEKAASIFAAHRAEAEEALATHKTEEAAKKALVDKGLAEYQAINEEIRKTQVIDRRTTTDRVAALFGLALTGLSDALMAGMGVSQHMQTDLMDRLQKMSQQDIENQRAALNDKRNAAAAKLTELGLARELLGDTREAYAFAAAARKDAYGLALEENAALSTSDATRAAYRGLGAQMRAESAKERLDVYKTLLKKKLTAFDLSMMKMAGVSDALIEKLASENDMGPVTGKSPPLPGGPPTKTQAGSITIDAHRSPVPGLYLLTDDSTVVSKDDTENAKKVKSAYNAARNALENLREEWAVISDPNASLAAKQQAVAAYNSQLAVIPGYLSQISGSGTPQESETKRILKSIPAVPTTNDLDPSNWIIRLENWRKDLPEDPFARNIENLERVTNGRLESYWYRMGEAPTTSAPAPQNAPRAPTKPKASGPKKSGGKKVGGKMPWEK